MDFDALLRHYFGTADIESVTDESFARGHEALAIDFGTERDPGRRFALWALMHMLGVAPAPADIFETEMEREAAWRFMRIADRTNDP
ncbi:hypothetical protein [Sphingomonas sp. LaA6.9]|uniref:hypothetical protein n=1 Tax=Sphingomonas sp. LaA6.9 TaxID=2919914 RepID=UPI001F4F7C79|nr:hypothetical protein [Sphingomonas sp. LaA6.9]MCJ8158369.1 hypothetical protein [Sphingomonas sp. LaA6.9]